MSRADMDGVVQEQGSIPPTLSRRSSQDTPPQPPSRTRYYDMSPQVPRRNVVNPEIRRTNSRSPGRHSPGSRRHNHRRSGSSFRRSERSLGNSSHHSASSSSRRSRSSSRHRLSSSSGHRRSSSGHRSSRRNDGMRRSNSENRPGAYNYYDDMNDYAEALKEKGRSISTGRRSPRRSEGSRRSPQPERKKERSPQTEPKIYDEAFGDYPKSPKSSKSDKAVAGSYEVPITPTSVLTQTSHLDEMSDEEIILPGAYASNLDGDDQRLSRLHGRSKSRRSRNHMRVSMGGLDPLNLMDTSNSNSSSMTSAERSALERKDSRRSTMMRAQSERSRWSSRRLLVRDDSSSANSIAIATAIQPALSESSESEEEVREEIVNDELDDEDLENQSVPKHQTDASESTATGSISADDVVTEIVKPNRFARNKRLHRQQSQKRIQRRRQRDRYCCFVAVFLLIFGGGAIFLVLRPDLTSSDDSPLGIATTNSTENPTRNPSAAPTIAVETLQPTESYLYDPPSEEQCIAIQNNKMVAGQSNMTYRHFNLHFDVLVDDQESLEIDSLVDELLVAIESYFVPSLAGCDDVISSEEGTRRRLALLRYVIANADIDGEVGVDESCTTTEEQPCFRVVVNLKVYLKGNVRIAQLLNLIVGVVNMDGFKGVSLGNGLRRQLEEHPTLVQRWKMGKVFKDISLARIESANAASSAPSMVPSISPSSNAPSSSPTATPSSPPSSTDAPIAVEMDSTTPPPVSQDPTTDTSTPPTAVADTPNPTAASTPSPTVARSRSPTVSPTRTPTREPSETPSESPTSKPSIMHSEAPSQSPTASPTSKPSDAPSAFPTGNPTGTPTRNPTSAPSGEPSSGPSPAPSSRPTTAEPTPTPAPFPPPTPGGGDGLSPPTAADIRTLDFDDLLTLAGNCLVDSTSMDDTYENLIWTNFGVMDSTCFGCYGPSCPNAIRFSDASATPSTASFERPTEETFDMISMWVYNPIYPFALTGYESDRTTVVHSAVYPYIGNGWHQLDLSAFQNVAIFEIKSTDLLPTFDTAFDAIQLRFN